ncbi:MAG: hypothetical protein ROZ37_20495 [Aromatoleum sp.]|jgi:hypothetical protein|uniref:hypothetical protein n=1 Tax=Aromatoleum sp. TaxID=2307007 RepID=UPI0028941A47|nr:hypothetical protein [Aromatoleum sp.]MDT3672706.1 hypothetical protein [Aromatoleum sp.]
MDGNSSDAGPREWQAFADRCRERSRQYERAARAHLVMIVLTLVAGLVVFVGGERLGHWVFSSRAEREATAELDAAAARLKREFAALADPAAEFIRTLPAHVRPVLEKFLRDLAGLPPPSSPNETPGAGPTVPYQPVPVPTPPPPAPADGASSAPPPTPAPPAAAAAPPTAAPPVRSEARSRREPSVAQLEAQLKQYDRLIALSERNVALLAEIAAERERQAESADRYFIETLKSNTATQVAQIEADTARDRAQTELDIARATAEAQTTAATESTTRADDLNALVSGSVTRVGAVVLVIWLVRIFLRDRQRYVQRSDFFRGLADAMSLSRGDLAVFRELLPQIVPPAIPEGEEVSLPMEAVGQLLAGAAKRGG